MTDVDSSKPCACTQNLIDLLRAQVPKKDQLQKIVCAGCGKTVLVNTERKYCFDCEEKYKEDKVV